MSDLPGEREQAVRASLRSLQTVLIISSISAAVVVVFGMAFRP
jgi:hypothetical protein